jgi:hypothetical protein
MPNAVRTGPVLLSETLLLHRDQVPAGYASLAEASDRHGRSINGLRLLARQRRITAVMIRGKIYVALADVARLDEPQPYPPPAAA